MASRIWRWRVQLLRALRENVQKREPRLPRRLYPEHLNKGKRRPVAVASVRYRSEVRTVDKIATILISCLPSAVMGFFFWLIQRRIKNADKKREEEEKKRRTEEEKRERLREKQQLYVVKGISAAIALGEATAKAVQRIPDAHCNGDMHAALEYAAKVKHEQRDFLDEQGIIQLYE